MKNSIETGQRDNLRLNLKERKPHYNSVLSNEEIIHSERSEKAINKQIARMKNARHEKEEIAIL